MRITKKLESEILQVMEDYWGSYLKGDIDKWASFLPDDYRNIGTTKEEIWESKSDILEYTQRVFSQVVGMAEIRNKKTQIIPYDPYIMVHELGDLYVKADEGWIYYAQCRLSSLLEKSVAGWKILHQHGSYPDSKSDEGEAFGFDELKIENKKLKDAIQRRTIELERKNRELEIEAALEKVRSKSLAMHHTSELQDVIHTVHEELLKLKIPIVGGSFIVINSEIDTELYAWGAGGTAYTVQRVHIPHFDMPFGTNLMDGIKQGPGFFTEYFSQEEKIAYFTELFKHPPWSGLSKKEQKATLGSSGDYTRSVVVSKHTTIFLINHNGRKFTEDENKILKRFASTFEQAYTRFLDLQKAEAQAREAQIEAALERVRAASMAINKTGDLNNIISTVFTQLKLLGFNNVECEIILFESEKMDCKIWPSNEVENVLPRSYHIPYNNYKIYQFLLNSWKSGGDYCHYELKGMSKKAWENWLFNQTDWKNIPAAVQKSMRDVKKVFLYGATMSHGILEIGSTQRLEDGMFEIIQRFAKVFEQSYTRFLDLQLAEEQAREAEIQLSLERVRARTMAMQKSDELPEAANLLFNQVQSLGMPAWSAGYCIWEDDHQAIKAWMSSEGVLQPPFVAPTTEDELFMEMRIGHEDGKNFHMVEMGGEELVDHYKYMRTLPVVGEILDSIIEAGHPLPTFQIMHYAYFSHGLLLFITYEPVPEAHDLFKRFAKVFDQTYTRFLDLQKAEAQTREAQIEAALEKVRSRSLAMHKAEELGEVVTVVVEKLRELEIPVDDGVAIVTNIEGSKDQIEWMENPGFPSAIKFNQPYFDHPVLRDYWKAKNEGLDFIAPHYTAAENKTFLNHIFELSDYKNTPQEVKDYCLSAESYSYSAAFQKNSSIFINDYSGKTLTKEEIDIVKRFSRVFEQAYVRFLDLQKAEEQAREAKIEAALERVRSRSMAMHKTEELSEVVKLLFEEIKPFGFAKSGCELILVDEKNDQLQFWNSNPVQDKILNCFNIPKSIHPFFQKQWKAWEDQVPTLTIVLEGQEKKEFDQLIFSKTDFKYLPNDVKKFILNHGNVDVFSHAIMKHGLLEVVDALPISEEMFSILERFAKVFEHTYTRFLDLKKAEEQAREAQIEAALEKIRAQSMMMQHSEELSTTSNVFHEQLLQLELPSEFSYVWLPNEENGTHMFWATWSENNRGKMIARSKAYTYPLDKSEPYTAACYKMWESNEDVFVNPIEPEEVEGFFSTWSELVGEAESLKAKNFPDGLYYAEAYMKYGCFGINIRRALDNKEQEVLRRFANEFERTYTRFLDLQRAEAQAREAKIEAALEKVRARAMGMHKSDELSDLVSLVFKELVALDMELTRCLIWVFNKDHSAQWWMANPEDDSKSRNFYIPNHDHPCYQAFIKAWSDNEKMWEYILEGEAKESFDQYLFNETDLKNLPKYVKDAMRKPDQVILTATFNNFGALQAAGLESLSEENKDILRRFGQVFDQTYTRFLDLQKAEGQAREAQIEAALERVRSRTMAMHHSDELGDVASVLYKQLIGLGISDFFNCGFIIVKEDEGEQYGWMTQPEGDFEEKINLPYPGDKVMKNRLDAWKKNVPVFHQCVRGQALKKHLKYVADRAHSQHQVETLMPFMPDPVYFYCGNFSEGYLHIVTGEKLEDEAESILARFVKVFEQTYTRFQDLQKAEAQAREAQIETALERVRSRTMAMYNSNELEQVVNELTFQFKTLRKETVACWISLVNIKENTLEIWNNTGQNNQKSNYTVKGTDYYTFQDDIEAFKNKELYRQFALEKNVAQKKIKEQLQFEIGHIPEDLDEYHLLQCRHTFGFMGFSSWSMADEESFSLLSRFCKVFEQTYTRFLDLQKAEAQAREAQIETALERVRAASMAMHASEELKEVIKVIFDQLAHLNINAEHAGIVVDFEPKKDWHFWIAETQDIPAKVSVPYLDLIWDRQFTEAKKSGKDFFVTQLDFEEKNKFYSTLLPHIPGLSKEVNDFYFGCPGLAISTVIEKDIGLYIENFSGTPYSAEENNILRRFAKVFQQSYTRFLDLKKAEAQARESQIEAALERVRAKSMAMHKSEELADLSLELVKQVQALGVATWFCAFNIYDDDPAGSLEWGSNGMGTFPKYRTPREGIFLRYYEAGQKGEKLLVNEIGEDECPAHYEYLCTLPGVGDQLLKMKSDGIPFPTSQIDHVAYFKYGYVLFITYDPVPESYDVFKRFAKVFEQSYTRFLDLKKAEAQALESQIQLALERVRARTMAMQSSDELTEVSYLLNKQVVELGIPTRGCAFNIYNEHDSTEWFSNLEGTLPVYQTPRENIFLKYYKAGQRGETLWIEEFSGERIKEHYKYLSTLIVSGSDGETIDVIQDTPEYQVDHVAYFKYGYLLFITLEPAPEAHDVFKRFAKEFEQTYIRFLDLKKAEAQAREANIEAALEKVRSRTMAMHSSDELPEAANLLFHEIQALGLPTWSAGYNILSPDKKTAECWMSSEGTIQPPFTLPFENEKSFIEQYEFFQGEESFLVQELSGEALKRHYDYMKTVPKIGEIITELENSGIQLPTHQVNHLCKFKQGYLLFITYELVPEAHEIFIRFTTVFEQTYTRFLDLRKAEMQARESQIEAALERIRSRSMAMHQSEELIEVASLMYDELAKLGFPSVHCGFGLIDEKSKKQEMWASRTNTKLLEYFELPLFGDNVFQQRYDAWKNKEAFFEQILSSKALQDHLKVAMPDEILTDREKESKQDMPDPVYLYFGNFNQGYLQLISPEPLLDDHRNILVRFAKNFEQTYTRFLDLKKAEEQARKAKIDAALERVRARSMAMHSSDELVEASDVMFAELNNLDLNILRIGICTIDADTGAAEIWSRSEIKGKLKNSIVGVVPMGVHPVFDSMVHAWKSKKPFFISERKGEEVKDYYTKLAPYLSYPLPKVYNEKETVSTFFFSEGSLNVISIDPLTERECDIMVRFARVFGQMHTRFLDLQRAEKQAKEAKKQAALDRVRGEIASMRSTEDLNRITPVIWRELQVMEVPFIRCGVFIVDEETEVVNAYLSSPDGLALGVLHLPFDVNNQTTNTVKFWKQKKVYTEHWDKQDFIDWTKSMVKLGQIQNVNSYQGSSKIPESLHLHFIPFRQGMLYVGNVHSLNRDEITLVRTLAESFSIAYARYEDFRNLEEAKNKIEITLSELKSTQAQLIQSEKMASLGELTAGIAHEIQNPLNFVNNFSEVSSELVDELQEEIDKGDVEEVKLISTDLKENLGKIHHHGKRAESIVKGMLMHSRSSKGEKLLTDINALCDEFLRLSYHGLRAKDRSFNADFEMAFDETIPKIAVIPQDMGRVLLNLINNAFQATKELKPLQGMTSREPIVKVVTKKHGDKIEISVIDNGPGIPDEIKDKIFQPFFTTKPTGQGTGLGLSLAYDIVKAHGGEISVNSESSEGTTFSISLPYNNQT